MRLSTEGAASSCIQTYLPLSIVQLISGETCDT